MGSKTALLGGELGDILLGEASDTRRFVDLFAGSGAVSHFMAQLTKLPVLSVDLQEYSRILSASIIERTTSLTDEPSLAAWSASNQSSNCNSPDDNSKLSAAQVMSARIESSVATEGFITRHYGGHYFSPSQARTLDALYKTLPATEPLRTVALAALLHAASACAAAPGHTAQPFQPTESLLPYIDQAWSRNITSVVNAAVEQLAKKFACTQGKAIVGKAEKVVSTLGEGDLVFCDPPYSSVQYSRFYHVLEGIARGGWDTVSGNGRAPSRTFRKTSEFSMKSKAPAAMESLLTGLRKQGCRVIITFPDADASNGLSGKEIVTMATDDWFVEPHYVDSVHSTLGGTNDGSSRGSRKKLKETIIILSPKSTVVNIPIITSSLAEPAPKLQISVPVGL